MCKTSWRVATALWAIAWPVLPLAAQPRPAGFRVTAPGHQPQNCSARILIELIDRQGTPAATPVPFKAVVEVWYGGKLVDTKSETFKKGDKSETEDVRVARPGVHEIRVRYPEFSDGVFRFMAGAGRQRCWLPPRGLRVVPAVWMPPPPPAPARLTLELFGPPETNLAGNPIDIEAWVTEGAVERPLSISFETTLGRLNPPVMVIRPGESKGSIQLISDVRGEGVIKVRSFPATVRFLEGRTRFPFRIRPKITDLLIRPRTSNTVGLLDSLQFSVEAVGGPPDGPVQLHLEAQDLPGHFRIPSIDLTPERSNAESAFLPYRMGHGLIKVSMASLGKSQPVQVAWPWPHFLLSGLGGYLPLLLIWRGLGIRIGLAVFAAAMVLYWGLTLGALGYDGPRQVLGSLWSSFLTPAAVAAAGAWWCARRRVAGRIVGQSPGGTMQEVIAAPPSLSGTVRIFLASSSELRDDRDDFDLYFRQQNDELRRRGVYLQIVRWENFLDAMSETRLQAEYNKAIGECDIFVCLFFTKAGMFTEEEFKVAHRRFLETGKPRIYTFFKNADIRIGNARKEDLDTLWAFQRELRDLGHFWTNYESTEDLKLRFRDQLDKLMAGGQPVAPTATAR